MGDSQLSPLPRSGATGSARVLVADSLSEVAVETLKATSGIEVVVDVGRDNSELLDVVGEFDGLVVRGRTKVTAAVIAAAARLRVVGRAGIGVDNIDVEAATRRGIVVMNTPVGNAVTTAEHALSLLVSLARRIPAADAAMKRGEWPKERFTGVELAGKTLGVVGLGNVGRIVAERARGLHLEVVGYDPFVSESRARELGIEVLPLPELLSRSDAITVHTPSAPETIGLIGAHNLAVLKRGVLLVNAARGGIFDEQALLEGLESGVIGGVALDVYTEEPPASTELERLVRHPAVVATPHIGASTIEAQERVAQQSASQVAAFLTAGVVSNAVNQPAVPDEVAGIHVQYVLLARRLSQFLIYARQRPARTLEVTLAGASAELPKSTLAHAALAELLAPMLDAPVNAVNAAVLAAERGVEVSEATSAGPTLHGIDYTGLVRLSIVDGTGARTSVAGTLAADGTPRLVDWNGRRIDAQLEGRILVLQNADTPGVIGRVGTLLGEAGVNVSRMQMGRDRPGGSAVSLWALDGAPPASLLSRLSAIDQVDSATVAVLVQALACQPLTRRPPFQSPWRIASAPATTAGYAQIGPPLGTADVGRNAYWCSDREGPPSAPMAERRAISGIKTGRNGFSPREYQVLGCLVQGLPNQEIGVKLGIRSKTVAHHVTRILAKTGKSNRTQVAVEAVRRGWVD